MGNGVFNLTLYVFFFLPGECITVNHSFTTSNLFVCTFFILFQLVFRLTFWNLTSSMLLWDPWSAFSVSVLLVTFHSLHFSSPLVFVAFGCVLSSLQGPSDDGEEGKRPARRTQFGKGDWLLVTVSVGFFTCYVQHLSWRRGSFKYSFKLSVRQWVNWFVSRLHFVAASLCGNSYFVMWL